VLNEETFNSFAALTYFIRRGGVLVCSVSPPYQELAIRHRARALFSPT